MINRVTATLAIVAISAIANSASAEDVTLRFGTHNGASSPGATEGAQPLMDAAKEAGVGINFEFYPGEQAGKALQMFDLVRTGAVDIGFLGTGYVSSDKLPLIGTWEVPGLATTSCSVVNAMETLGSPGGIIYENDFKPNGIRILAYFPYPPYGPAVSRTEITSVADLEGMKMRNAGGLMELTVQALGGVPVKMPAPEIYQSLQRGTLDTVLLSFLSVKSLDLASVAHYGSTGFSFGTPGDLVAISEKRFQSLTPEQQEALLSAGRAASQHWCSYVDSVESQNIAEMQANGLSLHKWTADEIAEMKEKTASIPADWAKKLDDLGRPGTETLKAFAAALQN